jgi:hypothetical protein
VPADVSRDLTNEEVGGCLFSRKGQRAVIRVARKPRAEVGEVITYRASAA